MICSRSPELTSYHFNHKQLLYRPRQTPKAEHSRFRPVECPQSPRLRLVRLLSSPNSSPTLSRVVSKPKSCLRKNSSKAINKRVAFADENGQPLTVVHLIIRESSSSTSIQDQRSCLGQPKDPLGVAKSPPHDRLQLGVQQPTWDFAAFFARLKDSFIQMKCCNISADTLIGKVWTHSNPKKTVCMKVTVDSWRSFQYIPFTFTEQKHCGGLDVDIFFFEVKLPKILNPHERTEFYFEFWNGPAHWRTDNLGLNNRLLIGDDTAMVSNYHQLLEKGSSPPITPAGTKRVQKMDGWMASNNQDLQELQHLYKHLLSRSKLRSR